MPIINFCYVGLLGEVYEQLHLPAPKIVVAPNSEDMFVGCIDVQVPRSPTVTQTVRCSSSPFPTAAAAEQETARLALKRLNEECDLQYKDLNYDDSLLYKNLYDHQTLNCSVISAQYSNLSREFSFVKECYVATVAQKNEYMNERIVLRNAIGECYAVVNRVAADLPPFPAAPQVSDPSQPNSNQNV